MNTQELMKEAWDSFNTPSKVKEKKNKKQKKEDEKPVKIFTLDTETRGLFGDIFRVGLFDGKQFFATNSFKELKSILYHYTKEYDCHLYIHNLDFDLSKMAADLIPQADLKKSIFINNNVTVFRSSISMSQTTEENDIISQPITFHDSLKLIQGRLKDICKDFGIEEKKAKIELKDHIINLGWALNKKGKPIKNNSEYDSFESEGNYFMKVDPYEKELNEYLRNDCISLYEIVSMLHDLSGLNIYDFLKCPTTASLAMKVYQKNYADDYEQAISTNYHGKWGEFLEKFVRSSYWGGRTEVFQPILKEGYHYDVNSLYPYVMKNHRIPVGRPLHYQGDAARNIFKHWYSYKQGGGFLEVDIHIPEDLHIPPLPAMRNKKLMFPVGKIHGVWTFEEIELALEMGARIHQIYQCVYFDKTKYIFKDFVSYFEEIKNNSEGAKRVFSKLMQNALYGKFGMRRIRKTLLPIKYKEKCEAKGYKYTDHHNDLFPEEFIEAEIPSRADYIQPHIASYVTSLARIVLYRGLIQQLKLGEVAYCDTDSIACEKKMPDGMVHNKEYGKWKLESELELGIFIQPKTYYEKDKNGEETKKFKGVPKKYIKELTQEKYLDIIEHLKDVQVRQENGEKINKTDAYYPIFTGEKKRMKFATTFKNGHVNFDLHLEVNKGIILINKQKRIMDYVGNTSKPYVFNEFGEIFEQEMREVAEKEMMKEYDDLEDPIKEKINQIGFILIPGKDDLFYSEYKQLSRSIKMKYFRKEKGQALDTWCQEAGEDLNELIENWRQY